MEKWNAWESRQKYKRNFHASNVAIRWSHSKQIACGKELINTSMEQNSKYWINCSVYEFYHIWKAYSFRPWGKGTVYLKKKKILAQLAFNQEEVSWTNCTNHMKKTPDRAKV